MLKKKAINRIFITTTAVFVVLIFSSFKLMRNDSVIYDDAYYINNNDEVILYTLNNDNFVTKTSVYVDNKLSIEKKIKTLLEIMIDKHNKTSLLPNNFKPILPKNTEVLDIKIEEGILKVNFSKVILNINMESSDKMIEAITYTLSSFADIIGIEIYVDNILLEYAPNTNKKLPSLLTKEYGINKTYNIDNTDNIKRVNLYYIYSTNDNDYLVPVSKYMNDKREKIEIIVEELTNKLIKEKNLKSYLSNKLSLLYYDIDINSLKLTFNEEIIHNINEIDPLIYSIFSNYDIKKIEIYDIENKLIEKNKKDIE